MVRLSYRYFFRRIRPIESTKREEEEEEKQNCNLESVEIKWEKPVADGDVKLWKKGEKITILFCRYILPIAYYDGDGEPDHECDEIISNFRH